MTDKKETIRIDAIKHRDKIIVNPDDAEIIAQRFFEQVNNVKDKTVALYWPIKSEIDTYPLITALLEKQTKICLPSTGKGNEPLKFLEWDGKTSLKDGGFGTKAPVETKGNQVIPDIIIVPLVAFDRYGTRLGYGQGHYDRTILQIKRQGHTPLTIGYAYDQQICLFPLPKETHDQKLDMIITPTQVY